MFVLTITAFCLPSLVLLIKTAKRFSRPTYQFHPILEVLIELVIFIFNPIVFFAAFVVDNHDCCASSAFNTEYLPEFYILCIPVLSISLAYKYSRSPWPPFMELLGGGSVLLLFLLNTAIGIQIISSDQSGGWIPILIGNSPIYLWLWHVMQARLNMNGGKQESYEDEEYLDLPENPKGRYSFERFANQILKYFIGLLPVSFLIYLVQYIFTQRPDGMIKLFTETYYHTFSTLTPLCENVDCGGHYLCSVAANGNPRFVGSKRVGIRNSKLIACNRQLLVCNAFEQWLSEVSPKTHQWIRRHYDKVGDHIHKNYDVYKDRRISHLVYLLMKPLEWTFTLILYSVDIQPENRIELQYTSKTPLSELTQSSSK
ncbi:DUF6688 domain-containing protein [Phaeocystidibacter marisrubri]|uniref:Uncharacterized protein n=1 Tax=Phaeocystidibacter marisrubri TaxID=1577780 RepID=A0A6L3ZHI0_9FLAO|nr:DUF6688 family protein [Phaeocystidibacter marisrubri]KAB2817287.1 hypothetical protein F8C82_02535 [Phaeocystidibacter marisrubri]